ncbi:hypothetical protein TanjilG_03412 [Lupinus angustifolius]|uniref:GATA transcription factor n=1 Tax=Lupinus angustifolius TaxID=3871 RepID=A0A4P1RE53_LUPAN|nr:PREDICTED: GATA transcription factor 7-like [Lupinus angustifolius]XP_019451004.1 PREDICTED: GATA transcription factor 7-like [Lupinus angustifolius]OIW08736.1 hypothetical protein TanjilG_03412 [Lupinus angustifolius]
MEVAKALKPTTLQREFIFQQASCMEILCFNVVNHNVVVGEDFSVDDLFDFSNGKGEEKEEKEEEDEEKDNASSSLESPDRTEDDSNSKSTTTAGCDSIFTSELVVPDDDLAELEWVSHFVDDSRPELSLMYQVPSKQPQVWVEPKTEPGSSLKLTFLPSEIPTKPRTTKSRKPNTRLWFFNSVLSGEPPAKKQKRKAEPEANRVQFQRQCSHCQVQKTPQWRTGPLGPKTLCNACGVRFKSGRLFPEYRPACSPTFSGHIHSNSHRKVLEIRRNKEVDEPETYLDRVQMVPNC